MDLRWYNPKIGASETVSAPRNDQDAEHMLGGTVESWAFVAEYGRLRADGMPIEQAMIFVGHHFRMWNLRHLPLAYPVG
jgi:hypothetical protein